MCACVRVYHYYYVLNITQSEVEIFVLKVLNKVD